MIPKRRSEAASKQSDHVSTSNPPVYYGHLNEDIDNYNNNKNSNLQVDETSNKYSTSNHELRNNNSNNNSFNNEPYFSSPSSSISQLNTSLTSGSRPLPNNNKNNKERMQDPTGLLRKMSAGFGPSCINLKNSDDTNPQHKIGAINTNRSVLIHNDSLSSDPSDVHNNNKSNNNNLNHQPTDEQPNEASGHLSRRQSSKKRVRKQPPVPMSNNAANVIKQRLLARLSNASKQHSFTSSDDENMNENGLSQSMQDKKFKMADNRVTEEEYEEEEDLNNDEEEDVDEDVRSTTEYTTNDEMDLESASVSLRANARMSVNLNNNVNRIGANQQLAGLLNNQSRQRDEPKTSGTDVEGSSMVNVVGGGGGGGCDGNTKMSSIDDYLVQNLRKEEVLAAKMSTFLSVNMLY